MPPVIESIQAVDHPLLRPAAFRTTFPGPIADMATPDWLVAMLQADASSTFEPDAAIRTDVRDALRLHGYKPTGRGKPASEYLARAGEQRSLVSINLPVDACNVVSLHSGFPISVIDLDRASPPIRIATATPGQAYVFNPSGQQIRLGGLACLFDAHGPCASPVKDSQRTKTDPATRHTLSVLWGCRPHEHRARRAVDWYRELLERAGGATAEVAVRVA